jgi:hypothetical protein
VQRLLGRNPATPHVESTRNDILVGTNRADAMERERKERGVGMQPRRKED